MYFLLNWNSPSLGDIRSFSGVYHLPTKSSDFDWFPQLMVN